MKNKESNLCILKGRAHIIVQLTMHNNQLTNLIFKFFIWLKIQETRNKIIKFKFHKSSLNMILRNKKRIYSH